MNTKGKIKTEDFLLAGNPHEMSFLKYQLVFSFKNGKQMLRSFNIISDNRIIRKVYLDKMIPVSNGINPVEIIVPIIFKEQYTAAQQAKTSGFKKAKANNGKSSANNQAKENAVRNLFINY